MTASLGSSTSTGSVAMRTASSCGPATARTLGSWPGSSNDARELPTPSTHLSAGSRPDALDTAGLDIGAGPRLAGRAALSVDIDAWRGELAPDRGALQRLRRPAPRRARRAARRTRQAAGVRARQATGCRNADVLTSEWERERFERSRAGWVSAPPTSARRPPSTAPLPEAAETHPGLAAAPPRRRRLVQRLRARDRLRFGPVYDAERFGVASSPLLATPMALLVTGPVTQNMSVPLAQDARGHPNPRVVIAVGDCARDCGVFRGGYGVVGAVGDVVPVDVAIPGCPPEPTAIIEALRALTGR